VQCESANTGEKNRRKTLVSKTKKKKRRGGEKNLGEKGGERRIEAVKKKPTLNKGVKSGTMPFNATRLRGKVMIQLGGGGFWVIFGGFVFYWLSWCREPKGEGKTMRTRTVVSSGQR